MLYFQKLVKKICLWKFPMFLIAFVFHVGKMTRLLSLTTNRLSFWLLHKNESDAESVHIPSIEMSDNRTKQFLVKVRVRLHTSAFPSRFLPVLQYVAQRCHVPKSYCRVSAPIAAGFFCFVFLFFVFFQYSAQTRQLSSIAIFRDGFSRFEQFIINYTQLITTNAKHKLWTMDIRLCCRCGFMARLSPRFSTLRVIVVYPLFIDTTQKNFPFLPLKPLFIRDKTPFDVPRLQLVLHPISLLLNHS